MPTAKATPIAERHLRLAPDLDNLFGVPKRTDSGYLLLYDDLESVYGSGFLSGSRGRLQRDRI
jgi:hypothetical protein